jgi:hypothetical protein
MVPPDSNTASPALVPDLRRVAAERKSRWLSNVCAVASAACGLLGLVILLLGYREGIALPDSPSGAGQKFTQSATALFGGIVVGAAFEFMSLLLLGVALLHSRRRRNTLMAAIPVLAFLMVLITLREMG